MDLWGWDYTGRNIGPEFHKQFRAMIDALSQPAFVKGRTWGNSLQDDLAKVMGTSSSGAVRTVKKMCVNFGLIIPESFSYKNVPNAKDLLTDRGRLIYSASVLEDQILLSVDMPDDVKNKATREIKRLYEEGYCDALLHYYYTYSDGTHLCPLRATLKALRKYKTLDKWEWYLLNTYVSHDDNLDEEAIFDNMIIKYRSGAFELGMQNVIAKPKGHQYIPQYFEFAGLIKITQRPSWFIVDSGRHQELKEEVLSSAFLTELYGMEANNG